MASAEVQRKAASGLMLVAAAAMAFSIALTMARVSYPGTGYVERGTFGPGSGTVLALAAFVLVVLGALLWGKRSRRQATWIGAAAFGFGLIVVLQTLDCMISWKDEAATRLAYHFELGWGLSPAAAHARAESLISTGVAHTAFSANVAVPIMAGLLSIAAGVMLWRLPRDGTLDTVDGGDPATSGGPIEAVLPRRDLWWAQVLFVAVSSITAVIGFVVLILLHGAYPLIGLLVLFVGSLRTVAFAWRLNEASPRRCVVTTSGIRWTPVMWGSDRVKPWSAVSALRLFPPKHPGRPNNYWVMFHGHGHLSLSGHLVNQELLVNAIKTNCDDLEIITR